MEETPKTLHNGEYNCSGEDCKFDHNQSRGHLLYHIRNNIPTKISHSQVNLLPERGDFGDQKLRAAFAAQIRAGKPVIFMPNSITEKNDWIGSVMKYRVYLFGVLPCGSKTCVVLDDIDVHVDVMVPTGVSSRQYDDTLRGLLISRNIVFSGISEVQRFRLHGFQKQKRPYKRIHFNNLKERKICIEYIKSLSGQLKQSGRDGLETASDDLGRDNYYFPKVAREFRFATADWNRIERYEALDAARITTNCAFALRVSVGDFCKLSKERRAEFLKPAHPLAKIIDRDPMIVGMWDIETHRTIQNGLVPTPADHDYTIFMICSAYFQHHSDESMLEVCVVDQASNAREGIRLIIECGTELGVLDTHMEVMGRMSPDITGAFNGGNFDWPLYREKLRRHELLVKLKSKLSSLPPIKSGRFADSEESANRWCFRREQVKIDAETRHGLDCVADFPGMLDTDVLPVFLKLYPRAEVRKSASLNFFLSKNGLSSKEDMPYKRMFRIYERALKLAGIKSCHCGEAQNHCGCCKEKIRELDFKPVPGGATMETTEYSEELYDDLCYTDDHCGQTSREKCCFCGKKPRNASDMADVGYYCVIDCVRPQQLYVKRSIIPDKRELSTMSYVSLYDSFYRADGMKVCNVIGAYCHKRDIAFSNARSDKSDSEKDHYPGAWVFPPNRGLHSDGWTETEVTLQDGTKIKKQTRSRPITGLDFASLYPSLMMAFNLSPDTVVYTREEAERLANEGYSLYHISPFEFERGVKKGSAGNQRLSREGWTVRHNGVFNPKKDNKTVSQYTKYEKYEFEHSGAKEIIKYAAKDGPTDEQRARLEEVRKANAKVTRRVAYEPTLGREPLPGESMGIFAFIVKKLFDKRVPIKGEFVRLSKLKEEMELQKQKKMTIVNPDGSLVELDYKADVCFNLNKVESKQKALKILANTFYGKSGDYKAPIYELLVAAGITCAGQANIKKVDQFVRAKGFATQYGDSVTGDTPIMCRFPSGDIGYRTIDQLGSNWAQYGDKEQAGCNAEVWTELGWTKINRVIRHYTNKNIYRVLTHTGCVDVTSDHSLLDTNAQKIKPVDVKVGTRLLHSDLPTRATTNYLDRLEAFSMGFFWANGSCGKYGWEVNNQNLGCLNRAKKELELVYGDNTFTIQPTVESSRVYKLVPTDNVKDIAMKYYELFYDPIVGTSGHNYKHIPDCVLNADLEFKRLFVEGYHAGDNGKCGYFQADNKGKLGSAGLYHLFCELGYDVSISAHSNVSDIYCLTGNCGGQWQEDSREVKHITDLGATAQYVYDLETENHHFAAGIGCMIVHNTDSLYLSCPDHYFEEVDAEYESALAQLAKEFEGVPNVPEPDPRDELATEYKKHRVAHRIKWWDQQVNISMRVMSALKEEVADFLLADNGTCFLNMAYEEVGYPTVFCGKKKYFLTPHIEKINFYPKEIFIRGIDIIKQGQARISKQLGEEFMREALSPENERELIDIAVDKIRKFYTMKPDPAMFMQSAKYRPNKKNIPVLSFVARMRDMQSKYANDPHMQALYEPPEAGDKFEYIIAKKNLRYTLEGKKIDNKKGDQMEFVRVYKASQETPNPMELDLNHYMKNSIVGLFARFIAYHPQFQPPAGMYSTEDKEQYKKMDEYCVDKAAKYLEAICDSITGFDKNAITQQGRDYRAIYARANKYVRVDMSARYGSAGYVVYGLNVHNEFDDARAQSTRMVEQIRDLARELSARADGAEYLKLNTRRDTGISVFRLKRLFNSAREFSISKYRVQLCNKMEEQIVEKLYQVIPRAARIIYKYERRLINLIEDMRKVKFENDIVLEEDDLNNLNDLPSEDQEIIAEVHKHMINMIAVYKVRAQVLAIAGAIEVSRARSINEPLEPRMNIRAEVMKESAQAEAIEDYEWC